MNFIARADGSAEMGSGHVMRLLTIAEELISRGHNVLFCCCSLTALLESYIQNLNCEIIKLDGKPASDADLCQTIKIGREKDVKAVILDGYQFDKDYLSKLNENFNLVFMDDELKLEAMKADIVINTSPFASPELYKSKAPNAHLLLGPKYALLRQEFREYEDNIISLEDRANIMITFGGTDVLGLTLPVTKALTSTFNAEKNFDVVVSNRLESKPADNVSVHENCNYMARLMSRCALAISAGGTTIGELSMMEVPTILVIVADNQQKHANWVKENGISLVIDARNGASVVREISQAAQELMNDLDRRTAMAIENKKIVDGRGVVRVVDKILSLNEN